MASSSHMRIMLILAISHVVVFFLGTLRVLVSLWHAGAEWHGLLH